MHLNKVFYFMLLSLAPLFGVTQSTEKIRLPAHTLNTRLYQSIVKFIPPGYMVMDQANGDLNDDSLVDKILVLKQKNEITEEENRLVLILIKQKDDTFKVVAKNRNIVLSLGGGGIHGDPYHRITIKNDFFSIEHFGGSGWRWNQVITFRYNKKVRCRYLYKIGSESWHIDSPKQLEMSLRTKKNFGEMLFSNYKNKWRDAK